MRSEAGSPFVDKTPTIAFPVCASGDAYSGEVVINQRDFASESIRTASGAVKVKDEMTIAFEIYVTPC